MNKKKYSHPGTAIRKGISAVLALCMAGTELLPAIAADEDVNALPLGTYEIETMEGADLWTSIYDKQMPGYSGEGFTYLCTSPVTFYVEVETEGLYDITFRACQILDEGGRMQTLSVNGVDYTYQIPYLDSWEDVDFGVFRLNAGVNQIVLKTAYGYAAYDTVTISEAVLPEVKGTDKPCDEKATPEAQALLKYLHSVYGEHILSGQQEIYGGGHMVSTNIRYDAESDTCTDGTKTYPIVAGDYGTDESGNKFPWHCIDEETGQEYTYSTQNRNYTYNDYNQEFRYLHDLTGKYPAIRGFDFNCHNPGFAWEDGVTDRMIDWTVEQNGICTASWHVTVPKEREKISSDWQDYTYGTNTDFVTANCMVEGTAEYVFFQEAMRLLATELLKLQEANVPVLFRPLHEAEGNPGNQGDGSGAWFWWSKEGCEVYHELWKLLYTTLTEEYGLHNLIWEQNLYAWSDESALWYTGDDYVDIVGFDKYNTEYNRHDGKQKGEPNEDAESKVFWSILGYVDNRKMVSMPENDSIPSMENVMIEQAKWLYFCTWYDDQGAEFISGAEYQNPETLKSTYQSEYCITLDELPADWRTSGDAENPETTENSENPETTENSETTEPSGINYGDADCSGSVDIVDVVAVNKHLLGREKLSNAGYQNADVDASGTLSPADALNILKLVVRLLTEDAFPVQS